MSLSREQMRTLFTNLVRANHYDAMMYSRVLRGELIAFYHPAEGAIAPGVAACSFLNADDNLSPHHRGHGIAHMLSKGIDIKYYLAEHTGKESGCCGGRSAFHFSFPDHKVYMMSGYIGYNFPVSVGWGWAAKRRNQRQVVMNCSGDGSYGQGRAHEALLMAQNMTLPIIFFCENNGMAIHSRAEDMHPTQDISSLAQGYGMPAVVVDGQDVFAVAEVALAAIDRARDGKGATFVECKTLRFKEHDVGTPDLSGWARRSDEEMAEIHKREPVTLATERMLADGVMTQAEIDSVHEAAAAEVEEAERFADSSEIARPSRDELLAGVFAP
ncbi:MAG: thiamine pyrophosphate-dependent dehydrogenase E1 component subunit alpha [Actinomycetia bacterium]|nr:thiamine pyrophosphate-dependent dehydrogenase E1 component subunit alpha [Actinomycetes bacterium]MCP3913245.1 thiamine pyrophosphate-dependent dehydrogenase E1 component subunit alpha [Actinomycetes bacterium]MCP4086611.1 thiamine pyrophosphate-dependent dehydrogenase E1 component subunit alpha [Actinomycetes bacterium]